MKFDSLFDAGFKEFGFRFFLVAFLPTFMVAMLVVGLDASGAPATAPAWDQARSTLKEFDLAQWTGLVLLVIVIALVTQPFQLALVRILEGYGWPAANTLVVWLTARQGRRRQALRDAIQIDAAEVSVEQQTAMSEAARRLSTYFPQAHRLLPTALGNALRAAEDLPTLRYGVDAIVVWPRLYPLVSTKLAATIDGARQQLDFLARMSVMFVLAAFISLAYLWHAWLWAAATVVVFLLFAWLAYRGAVEAAVAYGLTVQSAIDLHRFDFLKALHLALPKNAAEEEKIFRRTSEFLRQGLPHRLLYEHPKGEAKPVAPVEGTEAHTP